MKVVLATSVRVAKSVFELGEGWRFSNWFNISSNIHRIFQETKLAFLRCFCNTLLAVVFFV